LKKLTERQVRAIAPPEHGNRIHYDGEIPGFGIRVTANGVRSFVLNYRSGGRERRFTIGRHPVWTVAAARLEAQRLRQAIDLGNDPLRQREEGHKAPTVEQICERYIEEELGSKRPGTQRNYRSIIQKIIIPTIGDLRVSDVSFADISRMHRAISERTPYQANRSLAVTRRLFNLAIHWDLRSDNPTAGVRLNPEDPRERYLSTGEIQRLTTALEKRKDQPSAKAIMLLLLTGARKGEILSMRWEQIDFDRAIWTKPSAHTKQRRIHRVPLSATAVDLLRRMEEKRGGAYVFSPDGGSKPLVDIKKLWRAICAEACIDGCRLHDLRHTYASILVSEGASLPIIGSLLGHTQSGTTQRYAHLHDDPLRAATNRVADVMAGSDRIVLSEV
jgi:integrase